MTNRKRKEMDRRIRVRSIRREPPDIRKLGAAAIELAKAQAEADAQVEHERRLLRRRSSDAGDAA